MAETVLMMVTTYIFASDFSYLLVYFFSFHPKGIDIFVISPRKHMLWALIRSASPRRF